MWLHSRLFSGRSGSSSSEVSGSGVCGERTFWKRTLSEGKIEDGDLEHAVALMKKHDAIEDRAIEHMRRQLTVRLERYKKRLDLLEQAESDEVPVSPQYEAALAIRRQVIEAEREELLRWRDAGNLTDEGLRVLERELDHEERLTDRSGSG